MLELAILGLLRDEARHGYELRRLLAEYGLRRLSFGSLYPALRRLEKRGLIEAAEESGRRKAYRITAEGKEEFDALLADESGDVDDERAFELRLAFFRYLEPAERIGVLERRRAALIQRLAQSRTSIKRAAARTKARMDRYTLELMEHGVRSAEADIAWLDELIETERETGPKRSGRRRADGNAAAPATD
jgi:DNA-binding PadR family transcriptional regulator